MFLTRKLIRAINNRLIGGPHDFDEEAEYARKLIAKWRKRHPKKRLTARIVQDALINTWNDLHGFKEWRRVEVDLAVIADNVTRRSRRKPSRKSQERPKFGWF
ncbi:MAG: hypothetical protein ACR2IF_17595 [Terriglobales bacterium]